MQNANSDPAATSQAAVDPNSTIANGGEHTPPPATVTPPANEQAAAQTGADNKPPEASKETVTPPAEVKPVIPEKYELKLPEKSVLDSKHMEAVASYAKENGLTNEQAQKIVDRDSANAEAFQNKLVSEFNEQQKVWRDAAEKDAEIGGDKFKETTELANRVIEKFATPEIEKMLDATGYKNHPDMLRLFRRIGEKMSDDRINTVGEKIARTTAAASSTLYDHPTSQPKG